MIRFAMFLGVLLGCLPCAAQVDEEYEVYVLNVDGVYPFNPDTGQARREVTFWLWFDLLGLNWDEFTIEIEMSEPGFTFTSVEFPVASGGADFTPTASADGFSIVLNDVGWFLGQTIFQVKAIPPPGITGFETTVTGFSQLCCGGPAAEVTPTLSPPVYDHLVGLQTVAIPVPDFIRGDANGDGVVDIADAVATLDSLFSPQVVPCASAADANHDGDVNIADAVTLLVRLFDPTAAPLPEPTSCGIAELIPFPLCARSGCL